nr:hypothetical protein [Mesorhizobium sp.]
MSPGKPRFGGVFCVLTTQRQNIRIPVNCCSFDFARPDRPFALIEQTEEPQWATILLFFVIRGGNRHSVDARIGKAF